MEADPQDLPPLAKVFDDVFYLGRESERDDHGREREVSRADAVALAAPYDAERQRLREAIAANNRAFCTAPLHGLKPEFFAFCEIEGESPEIQFFESAEEASKAADAFLERAQELLADGLIEEPEIAYGRIYARCETSKGPAPDDADYDETWSFELEPRLTAEAENERLRARVAELEAALEEREADMHARIRAGYDKTVADCWRAKVAELEARLAKVDALALSAFQVISQPSMNYAECAHLAQKLALLAAEVT